MENRERQRIDSLNRESATGTASRAGGPHSRQPVTHNQGVDDDEQADRGREWFYTDRGRGGPGGRRSGEREEHKTHVIVKQKTTSAQFERESEDFLRRQMEELATWKASRRTRACCQRTSRDQAGDRAAGRPACEEGS